VYANARVNKVLVKANLICAVNWKRVYRSGFRIIIVFGTLHIVILISATHLLYKRCGGGVVGMTSKRRVVLPRQRPIIQRRKLKPLFVGTYNYFCGDVFYAFRVTARTLSHAPHTILLFGRYIIQHIILCIINTRIGRQTHRCDNPVPRKIEFRAVTCMIIIIIISCVHAFHCGYEIAGQVIRIKRTPPPKPYTRC